MKWRLDPPIEDPLTFTRQRVVAGVAAGLAAVLTGWASLPALDLALGAPLHTVVAALAGTTVTVGGGAVYTSVLSRLDAEKLLTDWSPRAGWPWPSTR